MINFASNVGKNFIFRVFGFQKCRPLTIKQYYYPYLIDEETGAQKCYLNLSKIAQLVSDGWVRAVPRQTSLKPNGAAMLFPCVWLTVRLGVGGGHKLTFHHLSSQGIWYPDPRQPSDIHASHPWRTGKDDLLGDQGLELHRLTMNQEGLDTQSTVERAGLALNSMERLG